LAEGPKTHLKAISGGRDASAQPQASPEPPDRPPLIATEEQTPITGVSLPAPEPPETPKAIYTPVAKRAFGRFELLVKMGSGGMATLYLARIRGPQQFQKLIAIKKVHEHLAEEAEFVDMFRDEARIAALIHHPNVVATFDMGQIDGAYFMAMEYVHGQNLKDLLNAAARRPDPLEWAIGVRLVSDVAKGLHAAHELRSPFGEPLNVIHRDVSPQNILISYDGHVKLTDFGIAYAAEKLSNTAAGRLKGKASYMSPEQTTQEPVDRRADIFSLGIVLFEAVCFERLFKDESEVATLLRVREARVPDPTTIRPDIPPALAEIVKRALAKDPFERFPTAEAFADRLDELLVDSGKVVSRRKLATLMSDLFYDRKKIKDRQIQLALERPADEPLAGLESEVEGTSSVVLHQPAGTPLPSPPASAGLPRWILFAGSVVAGLVLVLILGIWLLGRSAGRRQPTQQRTAAAMAQDKPQPTPMRPAMREPERPRPRPAAMPAVSPPPASPGIVSLTVKVTPRDAEATITFRKETQTGPFFQAALPPSKQREEIRITAPGYLPRIVPVVLNQNLTLPVELLPDPKARKTTRRRRSRRRRAMRPGERRPGPRRPEARRPGSMLLDL
jgi:serine/threonine-protein kinase